MVEGLTSFSSPPMGSCRTVDPTSVGRKGALDDRDRSQKDSFAALTRITRTPGSRSRHHAHEDPGDPSGEATPVPIPNTEVKLSSAEDTWGATPWEDRSSPG